jgi:hypothetical protein
MTNLDLAGKETGAGAGPTRPGPELSVLTRLGHTRP